MFVDRLNHQSGSNHWGAIARTVFVLYAATYWGDTAAAQAPPTPNHQSDNSAAASAGQLTDNLPPPSPEQIAQWIQQLDHNAYAVRQTAAERLAGAGLAARDALIKETDSPDPETRAATRRIVALIDESEANRKLAEFAADTDGHRGLTLPGWKEFGELVGQDEAARALFVDMQRHEGTLLEAMFGDRPHDNGTLWDERMMRLLNMRPNPRPQMVTPSIGGAATMIFLGALPQSEVTDARMNYLAALTRRPPIREAMLANRDPNAVRRLVAAWVVGCPIHSEPALNERLILIFVYDLKEALPLPAAIARGGPEYLTANPSLRATSAIILGRFGSKADIASIEPLLDDQSPYPVPNQNLPQGLVISVQVRDIALAMILHLSGQDLKDYGYTRARANPQTVFDPTSLGLDNNEQRDAAIAKWRAWKAEHVAPAANDR